MDMTLQKEGADSPIIVVATLQSTDGIVTMSRNVMDINQPAPNDFGVRQIYSFAVQRYLKGHSPTTITVVQFEGHVPVNEACVTPTMIAAARPKTTPDSCPMKPVCCSCTHWRGLIQPSGI